MTLAEIARLLGPQLALLAVFLYLLSKEIFVSGAQLTREREDHDKERMEWSTERQALIQERDEARQLYVDSLQQAIAEFKEKDQTMKLIAQAAQTGTTRTEKP